MIKGPALIALCHVRALERKRCPPQIGFLKICTEKFGHNKLGLSQVGL